MNEHNLTQVDREKLKQKGALRKLLSWGSNNNGQLGLGYESNAVSTPQEIDAFPGEAGQVKKISCSKLASAILLENGRVFTFGASRDGVLGHDFGLSAKNESIPRLVEGLEFERIEDISLGDHHGAAVNDKGEIFAWGSLTHGKLGLSREKHQNRARRLRDYGTGMQKVPRKSEFFGSAEGQIRAEKVHCTNQNTFVIGKAQCLRISWCDGYCS